MAETLTQSIEAACAKYNAALEAGNYDQALVISQSINHLAAALRNV